MPSRATPTPTPTPARSPDSRAWISPLDRDHPLAGAIYDARAHRLVSRADVVHAAAGATIVLLGEKHDNADHHVLQAEMIDELARVRRAPAVAFEMLDADEQSIVAASLLEHPRDADALSAAVRWDRKGWPAWPLYAPVFRAALAHDFPVLGANLSLARVRALARGGIDTMPPDEAERLHLRDALPPEAEQSLADELRDAHCGQLPEHAIAGMALAQRARDAEMASVLLSRPRGSGAVLIAGDGHVRRDRGVPWAIATEGGDAGAVLSIAFVEVAREKRDPEAYAARWHASALPFDYVWFTPRASDADPCAAFKAAR